MKSASVSVDGEIVSSIGRGILALAAVSKDDTIKDCERSANKLLNLRRWDDENGGRVCAFFLISSMRPRSPEKRVHRSSDGVSVSQKRGLIMMQSGRRVSKT